MNDLVKNNAELSERRRNDEIFDGKINNSSLKLSVPLVPFAVMLFMQQANRRDLRNSLKGPERCTVINLFSSFC